MHMKKITIFLASSIVEFAHERMMIENFIRNISDKFEEHYNIKIQPLLCENFDDAYAKTRKQDEYNEKIRESDFCFFIFFTKAGEYTREEFHVARTQFEKTGSPKIYTYFKVIEEGTGEESLYSFMDELDKTFGHFYGTFSQTQRDGSVVLLFPHNRTVPMSYFPLIFLSLERVIYITTGISITSSNNEKYQLICSKNLRDKRVRIIGIS